MLDILDKMDKVIRVMAIIACVSSLILTILSFIDLGPLVKLFGHKVEYEEGTYTIDGYASSLLGYKFTTPEDCMLDGESDRIDVSKGYCLAMVKEKIENGTYVVDLSASYASSSTALVLVAFDESFSKKKEDKIMDFNDEKLKEYGVIDYGDSERTTLLGKNCYKFTLKVEGYIANAIADAYMFVEDGYMWIIEIVYIEGRESEAEELLNAFSVYE